MSDPANDDILSLPGAQQEFLMVPVFIGLGRALAAAQILESAVASRVLQLEAEARKTSGVEVAFIELIEELFGQTLGHLFKRLKAVLPPDEAPDDLWETLQMRNTLVHHYMRGRLMWAMTDEGRSAMCEELEAMRARFEAMGVALQEESMRDLRRDGFGPERLLAELLRLRAEPPDADSPGGEIATG